ncbi:ABC transporter substrate-binding protein [Bdellovibrio sp. SKB1291214]|uniref:substrate-binding periplasmic protein n=1 Tax=Bdellovibrio sp. SKB1291214 TaxID=1732569 RepID=UPI000B51B911|nr:ABC transporter substrate-binding protein [Bdellovibrio sp. SKB1291214]UYL08126.1 ABC transporter substrate-binding protein [Bdellovibrio sp. SKB1291214]
MKILCWVLPLFCIAGSVEAKVANLVTFPIPLLVENKEKGLFIDLTREIASHVKTKFRVQVLAANKAKLAFFNGKVEGYFPGLDNSVPKDAVRTIPFYVRTNYIFYRENKPFKELKDLYGKNVGLTFRYHYPSQIQDNTKIKFSYAEDDIANMKRLAAGDIDAVIVEERSGLRALEISKAKGVSYSKESPVSNQDCYFAFKNDQEGRSLQKEFNVALEKMKADGSLQRVLNQSEPFAFKN